jgi:predicted nucleotidyltransferase component of viral defense system
MNETEPTGVRLHEDVELFREAVGFTAARTGFAARLIERDYFSTLLLAYLADATSGEVVFKGGTCWAKVLAGFYRLSEDLDFTIPLPVDAGRGTRRNRVERMKAAVSAVAGILPAFHLLRPLRGANNSAQYVGAVAYESVATGQAEEVKIEVSLREPLITPALVGKARTALLDPLTEQPLVQDLTLPCISRTEALAEKFRAALTRREGAVRDFYDLDYAVRKLALQVHDAEFVDLVRRKLEVPGNEPVVLGANRLNALRRQLGARLQPVLRPRDYDEFDLDRAFAIVTEMHRVLG